MMCWILEMKAGHFLGYLDEMQNPDMHNGSTQTCHVMMRHRP